MTKLGSVYLGSEVIDDGMKVLGYNLRVLDFATGRCLYRLRGVERPVRIESEVCKEGGQADGF
jgi:hypothetical protein